MNNSTIAWKTRAQLDDFMVKMFHGFPKPQNKFIRDMVSKDTGSWEVLRISRTRSTGIFISAAISSGDGSLPSF